MTHVPIRSRRLTLAARITALLAVVFACTAVFGPASAFAKQDDSTGTTDTTAVHQDVSPPLGSLSSSPAPTDKQKKEKEAKRGLPLPAGNTTDQATIQGSPGTGAAPTTGLGLEGIGEGLSGPSCFCAPPDPNGAVGATQYVQIVNTELAVFDRSSGALTYGPVSTNTVWTGFGGGCQINNDGDATVKYDQMA